MAWLLRNTAGEASLSSRTGSPPARSAGNALNYTKFVGGIDAPGRRWNWRWRDAVAARALPRWRRPRPPISIRNMSRCATVWSKRWRPAEAGDDGQPMEPVHRGAHGAAPSTVADAALDAAKEYTPRQHAAALRSLIAPARAAGCRDRADLRRDDLGQPPRHRPAAQHARCDAEGRRRRSRGRYRLRPAPGRDRRAGWRARRPSSSRPTKSSRSRRRSASTTPARRRASGDRGLCRRVRGPGAPDPAAARRCLRPDADDLHRPVRGVAPDQRRASRWPRRPRARRR